MPKLNVLLSVERFPTVKPSASECEHGPRHASGNRSALARTTEPCALRYLMIFFMMKTLHLAG